MPRTQFLEGSRGILIKKPLEREVFDKCHS